MSCADLRPVIDLLGLGLEDAVEGDAAAARAHLAACPACAARAASLGQAARALAAPAPAPAGAGRDALVARMVAAAAPEPREGGAVGWAALLVALLLAAGAAWVWRAERDGPPAATQPGDLEPGAPAAVTTGDDQPYYAQPAPLEAADPAPAVPPTVLPVGK